MKYLVLYVKECDYRLEIAHFGGTSCSTTLLQHHCEYTKHINKNKTQTNQTQTNKKKEKREVKYYDSSKGN